MTGWHFLQQVLQARGERVRHHAVAARAGEHLGLQRSLTAGKIDLPHQLLGRGPDPGVHQHGGQRRRAALVLLLREERHRAQLRPLGKRRMDERTPASARVRVKPGTLFSEPTG
jgi:hypothetical protein